MNALTPTDWMAHYKAVKLRLGAVSVPKPVTIKRPCIITEIDGYKPIQRDILDVSSDNYVERAFYSKWTRAPMAIDRGCYPNPIRIPNESEVARAVLEKMIPPKTPIPEIMRAVSKVYDVSVGDLMGARRAASIVFPRHVAMWICRTARPDRSLPDIGRRFGGRDHTTVLHAIRKIDRLIDEGSLTIPEPLLALTKPVGVEG